MLGNSSYSWVRAPVSWGSGRGCRQEAVLPAHLSPYRAWGELGTRLFTGSGRPAQDPPPWGKQSRGCWSSLDHTWLEQSLWTASSRRFWLWQLRNESSSHASGSCRESRAQQIRKIRTSPALRGGGARSISLLLLGVLYRRTPCPLGGKSAEPSSVLWPPADITNLWQKHPRPVPAPPAAPSPAWSLFVCRGHGQPAGLWLLWDQHQIFTKILE